MSRTRTLFFFPSILFLLFFLFPFTTRASFSQTLSYFQHMSNVLASDMGFKGDLVNQNLPSAQNNLEALQVGSAKVLNEREQNSQLFKDTTRVDFVNDQIYSFRLKKTVQVARLNFFKKYSPALGMGVNDQMNEVKSFTVKIPTANKLQTYSIHEQSYKGLKVFGTRMSLGEENGFVTHAMGQIASHLDKLNLDITPQKTEAEALQSALIKIGGQVSAQVKGNLGFASKGSKFTSESFHLVYRFEIPVDNPFGVYVVDVDAKTGEVINQINQVAYVDWHQNVMSSGTGVYNYNGSNEINFIADQTPDGKYVLLSDSKSLIPEIPFSAARTATLDDQTSPQENIIMSDNNIFDAPQEQIPASLHWGIQKTLEYFSNTYGYNGFDAAGVKTIWSHLEDKNSPKMLKAGGGFYYQGHLHFANGDNDASSQCGPMVSLDMIGHEFTHGIIANTSHLTTERISGALNEGFADIFASMVTYSVEHQNNDWIFKETDCKASTRNLSNPKLSISKQANYYPDTIEDNAYGDPNLEICISDDTDENNDNCWVHKNSTILSHWFYLLSEGGKGVNGNGENGGSYEVLGLGREKAADIAFLTMINPEMSNGDWDVVRKTSQTLAASIYGEDTPEYISVTNAWHAVGQGQAYQASDFGFTPSSGQENVEPWSATLSWMVDPSETGWRVRIYKQGAPQSVILKETFSINQSYGGKLSASVSITLDPGTVYYWSIQSKKPSVANVREGAKPDEWSETTGEQHYFITDTKEIKVVSPSSRDKPDAWSSEFKWEKIVGAKAYWVQISENPFPNNDEEAVNLVAAENVDASDPAHSSGNMMKASFSLRTNHDYYWRVIAIGPENKYGAWSQTFKITTQSPTATLKSPSMGAAIPPWGKPITTLEWNATKGAKAYKVEVSEDQNNFSLPPIFVDGGKTSVALNDLPNVSDKKTYYWRVTPQGPPIPSNNNQSDWGTPSAVNSLIVDAGKISKATLGSPSEGTHLPYLKNPSDTTSFNWSAVPGAEEYDVYVYVWSTVNFVKKTVSTTYADIPNVQNNLSNGYSWRVSARAKGITGPVSNFTTYIISPPAPIIDFPKEGDVVDIDQNSVAVWHTPVVIPGGYKISVSQSQFLSWPIKDKILASNAASIAMPLGKGNFYQLFIAGLARDGKEGPTSFVNFKTKSAAAPPPKKEEPKPEDKKPKSLSFRTNNNSFTYFIAPPGCTLSDTDNYIAGCQWDIKVPDVHNWFPATSNDMPSGTYNVYVDFYQFKLFNGLGYPSANKITYTIQALEDNVVVKTWTHTITQSEWVNGLLPFSYTFTK